MKAKISFDIDVDIHYIKGGCDACRMDDYDKEKVKEQIRDAINGIPSLLVVGHPADAVAEFKNIRNLDITLD